MNENEEPVQERSRGGNPHSENLATANDGKAYADNIDELKKRLEESAKTGKEFDETAMYGSRGGKPVGADLATQVVTILETVKKQDGNSHSSRLQAMLDEMEIEDAKARKELARRRSERLERNEQDAEEHDRKMAEIRLKHEQTMEEMRMKIELAQVENTSRGETDTERELKERLQKMEKFEEERKETRMREMEKTIKELTKIDPKDAKIKDLQEKLSALESDDDEEEHQWERLTPAEKIRQAQAEAAELAEAIGLQVPDGINLPQPKQSGFDYFMSTVAKQFDQFNVGEKFSAWIDDSLKDRGVPTKGHKRINPQSAWEEEEEEEEEEKSPAFYKRFATLAVQYDLDDDARDRISLETALTVEDCSRLRTMTLAKMQKEIRSEYEEAMQNEIPYDPRATLAGLVQNQKILLTPLPDEISGEYPMPVGPINGPAWKSLLKMKGLEEE